VGWELVDLSGQVPDALVQSSRPEKPGAQEEQASAARTVAVWYGLTDQRTYALSVQANDLGSTLRALHLHDGIIGGQVQVDGTTQQPHPDAPIHGRLQITDFTMKEAPLLARMLSAASLPGVLNLLNHDGLAFTKLLGDFSLANGAVTIKQLRTHGGALGLTTGGTVDVKASSLDLKGTIIPFYGLNTLLSHIPVLGTIITGGKGEGLISLTYYVSGKFADPAVTVNPASMLTPGSLRRIFDLFESNNHEVNIEQRFPPPSGGDSSP
jgi:hypothetical protein